ncbi:threonine aldolase family protein [Aliidiomarina celeris]|uniref:threonine aldolase family protein n=1 Tax=Aliidiomarina celeris TaxID=2249428 RepID=UPI000DE906F5|nr:beta-eliminating lyase-related protein [Aliidiomarina celeris]
MTTSVVSMLRQPNRSMPEQLRAMAELLERQAGEGVEKDAYGKGALIEQFETEVAKLLNKPVSVFLPSGTLAQPLALRICADQKQNANVGVHPSSHLELHEQNGYQELWRLHGVLIGASDKPFTLTDLQRAHAQQPLAAVVWELPARELGGQLPDWHDLVVQTQWARQQGIWVHFDGARLWQCEAAYNRSLNEIAGLADSIYVSFYKDLGGIAGAMLLGPADFIESARVWARRAGGNLYSVYPYLLAAQLGMQENLESVASAVHYAKQLGQALARLPGVDVLPSPPQAAMFHLHIEADKADLEQAMSVYKQQHNIEVLQAPRASRQVNGGNIQIIEVPVGRNAMAKPVEFWQRHLQALLNSLPA